MYVVYDIVVICALMINSSPVAALARLLKDLVNVPIPLETILPPSDCLTIIIHYTARCIEFGSRINVRVILNIGLSN